MRSGAIVGVLWLVAASAAAQPEPEAGAGPQPPAVAETLERAREAFERGVSAFDAGKTVDELARAHGRSRAGIEARLVRLGKLDASAVTTSLRYPPKPGGGQPRQDA